MKLEVQKNKINIQVNYKMSHKNISSLINQTEKDAETQIRKMYDAYQRFYNYVNKDLIDLKKINSAYLTPTQIENYRTLMNKSLVKVRRNIDDLDKYYQKQLKPFLDNLDK